MRCMTEDCPGYEPSACRIGGYCIIYDTHVSRGDECPGNDEYEEEE